MPLTVMPSAARIAVASIAWTTPPSVSWVSTRKTASSGQLRGSPQAQQAIDRSGVEAERLQVTQGGLQASHHQETTLGRQATYPKLEASRVLHGLGVIRGGHGEAVEIDEAGGLTDIAPGAHRISTPRSRQSLQGALPITGLQIHGGDALAEHAGGKAVGDGIESRLPDAVVGGEPDDHHLFDPPLAKQLLEAGTSLGPRQGITQAEGRIAVLSARALADELRTGQGPPSF